MLSSCRVLNRDQIKLLAIITMTFNHISHVLMTPGSILAEIFEDIGYFTAVTMCFFLAEGYRYTRSKKAYAQRLLIFAFISQVPYVLAVGFFQLNVLFTLFICFLIFCVMDSSLSDLRKKLLLTGLVLFTVICDWAVVLAVAAILFKRNEGFALGPGSRVRDRGGALLVPEHPGIRPTGRRGPSVLRSCHPPWVLCFIGDHRLRHRDSDPL